MAYQTQLSTVNRSVSSNKPKMSLLEGLAEALRAVRSRDDYKLFELEAMCTHSRIRRMLKLVGMSVFFSKERMPNSVYHTEENAIEATGCIEGIDCGPKVKALLLAISYELVGVIKDAENAAFEDAYANCI